MGLLDSSFEDGTMTENDEQAQDILGSFIHSVAEGIGTGIVKAAAPNAPPPPNNQGNVAHPTPAMPFNPMWLVWGGLGLIGVVLVIKAVSK